MEKRIAIITGGGMGIGKAIAMNLVNNNYYIIIVDVDKENGKRTMREAGENNSCFFNCNISNYEDVKLLFQNIIKIYGKIDVLVNNAGIIKDNMIWKMSEKEFDAVINTNLKGTWNMCKEAAIVMKKQKYGRIINISSRAWLGNAGQSNYSASKAGIVGLTRVLALELGKYNVYVNAIAPGLIETPLTFSLKYEIVQRLIAPQAIKSIGKPEDVAHAVAFLASEDTHFITGQTIYVDGGKSIGAGI